MARIAEQIGAEVDLHPGTARRVLRAHVQALHNGHPPKATTPWSHAMEILILIAAAAVLLIAVKWAFLPRPGALPRHRVRHLRLRLRLRLHPGTGPRHHRWSCGGGGAGSPCSAAAAAPARH